MVLQLQFQGPALMKLDLSLLSFSKHLYPLGSLHPPPLTGCAMFVAWSLCLWKTETVLYLHAYIGAVSFEEQQGGDVNF